LNAPADDAGRDQIYGEVAIDDEEQLDDLRIEVVLYGSASAISVR